MTVGFLARHQLVTLVDVIIVFLFDVDIQGLRRLELLLVITVASLV